MRKFFLIPLLTLVCSVMAWAGNQPAKAIEPVPFQFNEAAPAQKAAAPIRMEKAEVAEQDVLLVYGEVSQHFTTLEAAFAALPANSTPATITLLTDIALEFPNGSCLTLNKFHNVTIDLNGKVITAATTVSSGSQLIMNKGTLTIEDSSDNHDGIISNYSPYADPKGVPTYGNYTINNQGTLILNSGIIENSSPGSACYAVDNQTEWGATHPTKFIQNGGVVRQTGGGAAIRQYSGWKDAIETMNTVEIHGGVIEAKGCGVNIQYQGNKNYGQAVDKQVTFLMTDGEINLTTVAEGASKKFLVVSDYAGVPSRKNTHITVTGGITNGGLVAEGTEDIDISGGEFGYDFTLDYPSKFISGGTFRNRDETVYQKYWTLAGVKESYSNPSWAEWWEAAAWEEAGYYVDEEGVIYEILPSAQQMLLQCVKSGYCTEITPLEGSVKQTIVGPCNSQEVTESKTMAEIAQEIETAGEEVPASIIEINAAATEEKAVVTVTNDIEVEGIVIKKDNNKEGQIVVEEDVTLTVGNSGIVSENNDLTTVVVKPGGTIIIGNGGVDQQGNAIPVEIQNDGDKSGVLLIDPNAPDSVAEAIAKVVVYTRAHKDNGIEYWQQFASPVKGNMTITPLGVGQEDGVFTSVYEWNYSNDAWERVAGMPQGSDDVTYFDKTGWSGNNILTPFKAYNLINNSLLSEGGITYEFAGELVGNNDMTLNFPANGFCLFGNSYTAPIDLTTLFDQIENDMSLDNIDACVYIYNSQKDRFESVNALTLEMATLGFDEAPFTQIPPQQAFVMNLLNGGSAQTAVDYAKSVWGNPQTGNAAIMAPKRVNNTISAALNINVTDGISTDHVVLVEDNKYSDSYDNGADAEKYMNNSFNIYAIAERNLAIVASDNIENTELTFAAGNAVNYTMTFGKTMGDFVLVDRANNNQVAIEEGGIYTFAAQPNTTAEGRFAIVPAAKMPTAIENTEVKANVKCIYSITGQYFGEDFDVLPAGVYVIDGVKIVK